MSTISPLGPDASVTFSLAQLAKLEDDRLRDEARERAEGRERAARERRLADAKARDEELARVAAAERERTRLEREAAEEKARLDAKARAAIEVARIEAEAKARLEADNAARAQELAVLRLKNEGAARRATGGVAAALAITLCAAVGGGFAAKGRVEASRAEADALRADVRSLAEGRAEDRAAALAALDRRAAAVPAGVKAGRAKAEADAARDARAGASDDVRAYERAVEALERRAAHGAAFEREARRHSDLAAVAAGAGRERRDVAGPLAAAARAKATAEGGGAADVRAYERALDELRDALAGAGRPVAPIAGRREPVEGQATSNARCDPRDPMCGLDGKPLGS